MSKSNVTYYKRMFLAVSRFRAGVVLLNEAVNGQKEGIRLLSFSLISLNKKNDMSNSEFHNFHSILDKKLTW